MKNSTITERTSQQSQSNEPYVDFKDYYKNNGERPITAEEVK